MNIVELANKMGNDEIAYSNELNERLIKKDYGLYLYHGPNQTNDVIIDCNMNYLLAEDWEIIYDFDYSKEMTFPLYYNYHGTSCISLFMKMDDSCLGGMGQLYSSFNEKMFEGNIDSCFIFISELLKDEHS
ncbi:hypothetical protein [Paenibacillus tianjinensis]|uniref:Uncharacterized protein n=1 Tax=Paenibacillus tianjinensis TaxID=2810347 RepID=A0ABX7L5Z1_9BACL|nr:hypothetical protein [Paenibacillus tianjinensis]QSF43359.1 hypothetical protein JRJ22_19020 [Paenibacillus tianjinensis]